MTRGVLSLDRLVTGIRERVALLLAPWLRPPRVMGVAMHDCKEGEQVRVLTSNGETATLYAKGEAGGP